MIGADDSNTHDPRGEASGRKVAMRRSGIALLGVIIIAVSIVGVWYAVGPRGNAVMPEPQLQSGNERTFKLTPHAAPRAIPNVGFEDGQGNKRTLADFRGKVVLLNIWATWCGPCREALPHCARDRREV